jgi:hypothetical protein
MREATRAFHFSLAVAPILPIIGLVLQERWLAAAALLVTAVVWGAARPRYVWADDAGLILFLAGLAYAVWVNVAGGWLLPAACAALAAWDLGQFSRRLATQPIVENEAALWQAHWRQLAVALALGLVVSLAALTIQLQLPFWPAFGLALLAILALNQLLQA